MEEQKSGNSSNKKPGKHPILIITTICVVIAAAACGWLSYIQINRYEKGILEVCATQQDSYVQLVLDQINLKENRDVFKEPVHALCKGCHGNKQV